MSAFVDARKVGAGGQNEGEGAGKVALEEFEGIVIDARVGSGLGEVMTDDGELDYRHIAHIFSAGQTPDAASSTQTPAQETVAPQSQNLPEDESAVDMFRSILQKKGVTEEEVRQVIAARGKYSVETPIDDYPEEFLYGYVIRYWDQIFDIIQQSRKAKG